MGSLLEMDRLFVSQKGKLLEITTEYKIFDEKGSQVGVARQEGQTGLNKLARMTAFGMLATMRFAVYDVGGSKVVEINKPRGFKKVEFEVTDGSGMPVGKIARTKVYQKKARFAFTGTQGEPLGEMVSTKSLRTREFQILDAAGMEVGRITKKWAGLAKEALTTADNYLVEIEPGVTGPMRLLVLAGATSVETVLHPM